MRILQVSTADSRGGAEKVAWNLFEAYRARGHESWLAVGEKQGRDAHVFVVPNEAARSPWSRFFTGWRDRLYRAEGGPRLKTALGRITGGLADPGRRFDYYMGIEDFRFPGTARLLSLFGVRPDILHGHNLHGGYFDLRALPELSQALPVLLTLHDAWMLSGHCAHSFDCERWLTGCGSCPDLSIYPSIRRDATAYNWQRKAGIYARSRLYIATPSRWLMDKVERSMLAEGMVEGRVVPNGVDLELFSPGDQKRARALLDLSQDAHLLVATGVQMQSSQWKDYSTLRAAIRLAAESLPGGKIRCLVLGEEAPPEQLEGAVIEFVPFTVDPEMMARYYQAADAYLHPARADTFPSGVLEAMACGIPVLATAVGGIPEQLEEGCTGFLTAPGDAPALAERILQICSDPEMRQRMGSQARDRARRLYGLDRQVGEYLNWYTELLELGRV
jgi:glycosyltransferase involved in cell wall biosynthesis